MTVRAGTSAMTKSYVSSLASVSILALAVASPALADTTISADSTKALATSSSGNVTIAEDVAMTVKGSTPLTIDSNNTITIEDDATVTSDAANGRTGVLMASGTNGTLSNAGSILVEEDFVPADDDGNAKPDGPVASASNRTGIDVQSTTGTIDNSGTVYVEGLNSTGVRFADGWTGSFDNSGTIGVIGDNGIGISTGSTAGDFTVGGNVTAVGEGARALVIDGDVGGNLIIDGTVTKAASYTNDDGSTMVLSRSALRVSSPAVQVTGNVAGGILIDAPPLNLDSDNDDEDNDGIDDSDETTGSITSYGESPALVIGSEQDITIGGVQARDGIYSLAIDGTVSSNGYYSTFDTTAVVIGGQGGTVDLTNGISVGGTLRATTTDSKAVALLINEGVYAPSLFVSGQVTAGISSSGEGSAVAVRDLSGTLARVDNTGFISVSGAAEDETVALDLSRNTTGVSIYQYLSPEDEDARAEEMEDEDYDPSNPTIYTSITGDILTGSGNDLIDVASGKIAGETWFGTGDDTLNLYGDSRYSGTVHSGGDNLAVNLAGTAKFSGTIDAGGTPAVLTIDDSATFTGAITGGEQLTANVNSGLMQAANGETLTFANLSVGSEGSIGVVIDPDDQTSSSFVVNSADFEQGAGVAVNIQNVIGDDATYTILTADQMTGADGLEFRTDSIPLIYSASLASSDQSISVSLHRKTADELGLTKPQSSAYEAILGAAANDSYLEASILQADDMPALQSQFDQLLPDYAGGVFDFVMRSSRLATRRIADGIGQYDDMPVGVWLEALYFNGGAKGGEIVGYDNNGMGISGGWERKLGYSDVYAGLSGSWFKGKVSTGSYQDVDASKLEVGAHVRGNFGPIYAFARASYLRASMDSENTFTGTISDVDFTYTNTADWKGSGFTGTAGGYYDIALNRSFSLKPKAVLAYYRLKEDGYTQSGDSDAIEATVSGRTSTALTLEPALVASMKLENRPASENPMTFELEGGYRSVLSGGLGSVRASYDEGDEFTLDPASLKGGWTAEARIHGGGWDHLWQLAVGAEDTQGKFGMNARASLNVAF